MSDMSFDDLPQPEFRGQVAVDDLESDGENPNEQTDKMFGLLCENMRQKGWLGGPIICDAEYVIADGEHRWRAAKEIGLDEVPVEAYDIDDAERRLWRQELNKISGTHDKKRDALEYDYLLNQGKADAVTELADAAGEDLDELLDEIRVDHSKPPEYEYTVDHNVYFMDCIEGMREHLDDDSVDMVFTSPPYNVELDPSGSDWRGGGEGKVAYSDDRDWDEYVDWIGDICKELARVTAPDGHIFINIQVDTRGGDITPPTWVADAMPIPWRSYIVWSKGMLPPGAAHMQERGRFAQTWEPVLHFSEDPDKLNGNSNFAVWDVPPSNMEHSHDTGEHPAPFPVSLAQRAIDATTSPGDTVLDPFMGSGTTAVAAIESSRSYVGFELDEEGAYRPIIERRIQEAQRTVEAADAD